MMDYYCDICDKTIRRKSKTKHIRSKSHLYMSSYVKQKHTIGNVYWKDFEKILRDYVDGNRLKFPVFKTLIECELYDENIKFQSKSTPLYSFDNDGSYHISRLCKEISRCIRHRAKIIRKELFPETIIKNLSIIFYSYYYVMTPRYRLQQPRRILESKLFKHITNLSDFEKNDKYGYLAFMYDPVEGDEINEYVYYHICNFVTG